MSVDATYFSKACFERSLYLNHKAGDLSFFQNSKVNLTLMLQTRFSDSRNVFVNLDTYH